MTTEDLRALTPLIYGHLNPYGIFHLDLNARLPIDPIETVAAERPPLPLMTRMLGLGLSLC